jgi:hypothetical protein
MNRAVIKAAAAAAAAAVVLAMAGVARAETEVDAYGLGDHDPIPEQWTKIDDDLSIRVQILHDKTGELAAVVTRPEVLRVEVTFFAREGATDRAVNLTCMAYFMDAGAASSGDAVETKPCYQGRLSDATGKFVPIDLGLRFRPVASDPAGTSAVFVRVEDLEINDGVTLWPTYDWQGGTR